MILEFFIDIFLNIASFLLSTSTSVMAGVDIKSNLLEAFNFLSEAFAMARSILSLSTWRLSCNYITVINSITYL